MAKKKTSTVNTQTLLNAHRLQRLVAAHNGVALHLDDLKHQQSKQESTLRMNAAMLKARHTSESRALQKRHDLERAALTRQHAIEQTDLTARLKQHRVLESTRQASLRRSLAALVKKSRVLTKSKK